MKPFLLALLGTVATVGIPSVAYTQTAPTGQSISDILGCEEESSPSGTTPTPSPTITPGTLPIDDIVTGGGTGTGTGTGGGTGTGTGTGGGTGTGTGTGGSTPTPAPSATPTPSPSATPAPTPRPTPTPTPAPRPTPAPAPGVSLPTGSAAKCRQGMQMAKTDQASVNRAVAAKATLQTAAKKHGIDWRLLAAIGVRETNFRAINNPDPNDPGMGVFQLTRQTGVTEAQAHNLAFAADRAAKMLKDDMNYLKRKFPKFTQAQLMQATAAAYNFGPDDISGNPATIDQGTTGNNYGSNVLLLMNCY